MRQFRFQTLPQLRFHTIPAMLHRILQTVPVVELIKKGGRSYLLPFTDRCGAHQLICALCLDEAWAESMDAGVNWDKGKMALWRSQVSRGVSGAHP